MATAEVFDKLVMVTVDLDVNTSDCALAAEALGVPVRAIDPSHGLMMLDANAHRYAVMVEARAFRDRRATDYAVAGPFSNPAISTFDASTAHQ